MLFGGDAGNEAVLITALKTADYPWGYDTELVYQRVAFNKRFAAFVPKDDGTQGRFVVWLNHGYDPQPPQPPHRGAEHRWASITGGDVGSHDRFAFWRNFGWEVAPHQPQHRAVERKAASLFGGDLGAHATLIRWLNAGWEFTPSQPPTPRVWGAVLVGGDAGITAAFVVPVTIIGRAQLLGQEKQAALRGQDAPPAMLGQDKQATLLGQDMTAGLDGVKQDPSLEGEVDS